MDWISGELELAFEEEDCPICVLLDEAEERFFFWFALEGIGDGVTRDALLSRGETFCRRHARRLIKAVKESGRLLSASTIAHEFVEYILLGLVKDAHSRVAKRNRRGRTLADCAACRSLDEREANLISIFIHNLTDPNFVEQYKRGSGLCLSHQAMAIAMAGSEKVKKSIVKIEEGKLQELSYTLEEAIRKSRVEFSHEPKGAEMNAWQRALLKLSVYKGSNSNRGD
jgi:hypothetical protein